MSTASASNQFCAASGRARGPEYGPWSDRAINGCISMGLCSPRAERPAGCSCRPSIPRPFLWRWPLSPRTRELGQTSRFSWSSIRQVGTPVRDSRFPKACICSSCHRIRQNCNQQSAYGRSPTNRSQIGSSLRLTNWNRFKPSAVAGYKLILKVFADEPPFIGGLPL